VSSSKEFRLSAQDSVTAMERVIEQLTPVQQMVLANAVHQAKRRDVIAVPSANERTVNSLMRGGHPLVRENRVHRRVLTDFGVTVGDYLIRSGKFALVDLSSIVPDLSEVTN
jgi:hypothetical protein